jgi:hypothetical protein
MMLRVSNEVGDHFKDMIRLGDGLQITAGGSRSIGAYVGVMTLVEAIQVADKLEIDGETESPGCELSSLLNGFSRESVGPSGVFRAHPLTCCDGT